MIAIIVLSILFVFYVYIGYPIILWILSRNVESTFPKERYIGDVSIVMVVCNEITSVSKKIDNINNMIFSGGCKKIIIVDDSSIDGTPELIESKFPEVKLIKATKRMGKANGINLAMDIVDTELVAFVDCRQEVELQSLEYLASWFQTNSAMGAVSGELILKSENGNDFSEGMDGYWRYEKFIRKCEAKIGSVPGVSGALYMLRVSSFKPIEVNTLLDDVQIPMVACEQGYRIGYDERAIAWDVPSTSHKREKERKIRTLSGNYQLLQRFPLWVLPMGHPIWWKFFSHKIARLLAPVVALVSLFLSIYLSATGNYYALTYAILFISGLAVQPLSKYLPRLSKIKLVKLASSFITLNWFCILALFHYLTGIKSGSWKK
jgi:cellulose synthase/poly-beta-1,6-N-acetylglucosamine synthase-like glycosyltransferase